MPEAKFEEQVARAVKVAVAATEGDAAVVREARKAQQDAKRDRRAERERELAAKIVALPDKKYGVIVSDPEWKDEVWSEETGMDRAAANHYPVSSGGRDQVAAGREARGEGLRALDVDDKPASAHCARRDGGVGLRIQIELRLGEGRHLDRPLEQVEARDFVDRHARQSRMPGARHTMGFGDHVAAAGSFRKAEMLPRNDRAVFPERTKDRIELPRRSRVQDGMRGATKSRRRPNEANPPPAPGRRDLRPAVLEPAVHGHRRFLCRRHAGRSLHRRRQDRAGHPDARPRRRRGCSASPSSTGFPLETIRHAVTRGASEEPASILGAVVDSITTKSFSGGV